MRPILNIVRLIFGDLRMVAGYLVVVLVCLLQIVGFGFGCTIVDKPTAGTAAMALAVVGPPLGKQLVVVDARNQFDRVPA
jgi:uncharacterized membrane protein YccF (DUF307 family)